MLARLPWMFMAIRCLSRQLARAFLVSAQLANFSVSRGELRRRLELLFGRPPGGERC